MERRSNILTKLLKVEQITEVADGHSVVVCEGEIFVPCRLATVRSKAASVKLLGVVFEETCLASRDAMPFDLLKKKLMSQPETMASMVHSAAGYSVMRSLTEAPKYASAIIKILEQDNYSKRVGTHERIVENISMHLHILQFFLLLTYLDVVGISGFFAIIGRPHIVFLLHVHFRTKQHANGTCLILLELLW
ncbi:hypothetical protein GIB67_018820 [Kingdonia uniflora]|uniref:Uncharacterized protein n=1 Tax=Kingdonia uniflora TaxID=39325 RepID=A0A7J7NDX4_9MAGN|nr:hypothetical protein GIB67_018820 [Kingdonia uniflora]